ncbi:MAG: hypothetical protein WBB36_12700 [Chitinophagales bacterium]
MNDLDEILDEGTGIARQSFRTANGICRVSEDRIELIRNFNDTTSSLISASFLIRIILFLAISFLFIYQQFILGSMNFQLIWVYAIPASVILISIMGNLNAMLYRVRSILFIVLFLWFIYLEYERANTYTAVIYLIFAILLSMSFIRSFNYSYDTVIERKRIVQVRFINSIPAITRAYFLISYKNETGKERKRPILLPGLLQKGESEKHHAIEVMKAAGIML